jgi:hypothetical protein
MNEQLEQYVLTSPTEVAAFNQSAQLMVSQAQSTNGARKCHKRGATPKVTAGDTELLGLQNKPNGDCVLLCTIVTKHTQR